MTPVATGPVIVAVHGYPDDHSVWDGLTALLADDHRVVRYDVRGAGASDVPPSRAGYRMPHLVDDLFAVIDHVGEPVHLVGHDWGSIQSWPALTDPRAHGRIRGFTSISGPSLEHATVWLRGLRRDPRSRLRQLAHSYYTLLFQLPALPELAVRRGLMDRVVGPRSHADQANGVNLYRANMFGALRHGPSRPHRPPRPRHRADRRPVRHPAAGHRGPAAVRRRPANRPAPGRPLDREGRSATGGGTDPDGPAQALKRRLQAGSVMWVDGVVDARPTLNGQRNGVRVPDAENWIGGRYRLVRQLASGGMGTVWEAYDERLHRPVAVKQLQLQPGLSAADAEIAARRVMREAHLTARLHHPNAVQVFDVVDDDNHPCLVMQYVPSRSLQETVRTEGPLEPVAAARIGTQIAAALAAAHRAGIVHRDVKPGNILMADDGTAKIADFGISHAVDDVSLTSTGLVTGTPAYLAPEVARGADSDFATDVYSLGATLYMAVEGHPPVGNTDSNPMAVLHRVASGEVLPPQRSGPLTGILGAMMSLDPSQRPGMVDVANQLADISIAPSTTNNVDGETRALPRAAFAAPAAAAAAPAAYSAPQPDPAQDLPPELSPRAAKTDAPLLPLDDDSPPTRSRALWPVLIAAVLVIALGVVLGIVLLGNNGDSANTAGTGASNAPNSTHVSHSTRQSAPRTHAASTHSSPSTPKTSTPPTTPAQTPTARHTKQAPPPGHGKPTAGELVGAVHNYYTVVPGDLDTGWNLLTPHFQYTKAGNRQTYDSYWNSIQSVEVYAAQARPPHTVVATLVYHKKDGSTSTERTLFNFVRQNGELKINSTQVVG